MGLCLTLARLMLINLLSSQGLYSLLTMTRLHWMGRKGIRGARWGATVPVCMVSVATKVLYVWLLAVCVQLCHVSCARSTCASIHVLNL